jgi:hypothetical protein
MSFEDLAVPFKPRVRAVHIADEVSRRRVGDKHRATQAHVPRSALIRFA